MPVSDTVKLHANYRQNKRNLDSDPSLLSAPRDTFYRIGLIHRYRRATTLSLDLRKWKRKDPAPTPEVGFTEDTAVLTVGHQLKTVTFDLTGQWGRAQDDATHERSNLQRYRLGTHVRPTSRQWYSAFLEYSGKDSFGGVRRTRVSAGLRGSLRMGDRTFCRFGGRWTDYNSLGCSRTAEVGLEHSFASKRKISLRGRHTSWENSTRERENALMATYTIPLKIPITRKTSTGKIIGRVYDQGNGQGLPNAVLSLNGATAVTDSNGEFVFPSLKPGIYHLRVDTAGIRLDSIAAQKTPLVKVVRGGRETRADIAITRSASVRGRVVIHHPTTHRNIRMDPAGDRFVLADGNRGEPPSSNERSVEDDATGPGTTKGLANILLQLTGDSEVHRRITDSKGNFNFERVRPGRWRLEIVEGRIPKYYYLEKDAFDLHMAPAKDGEVVIRVLPKERRIRMLQEGATLREESEK